MSFWPNPNNPAAIKEFMERIGGKVTENLPLDLRLNAVKIMGDTELELIIAGSGGEQSG